MHVIDVTSLDLVDVHWEKLEENKIKIKTNPSILFLNQIAHGKLTFSLHKLLFIYHFVKFWPVNNYTK